MYADKEGYFGTPIQWVCAVLGGVGGWYFGDYVARKLGFYPGKWYQWKTYAYWTVRGLAVAGGAILGWVSGTALLKILTKYLLANPSVASRIPKIALWFLGMGGTTGRIANEVYAKYGTHIFNAKHGLDNLISRFGKRGVFDKAFSIVSSKITQAQNGSNQIHTTISGVKVTIRFYFKDGSFGSFNIIKGWASRIIGKLLK